MGVDFGIASSEISAKELLGSTSKEIEHIMHENFAAQVTHILLEWSTVCIAFFTVILIYMHFRIKGDVSTLIIGLAFFCSGVLDLFHTLADAQLLIKVEDYSSFIPFTWTLSRFLYAFILITGVTIAFLMKKRKIGKNDGRILIVTGLVFGLIAYLAIHISAVSENLPQTIYPDNIIVRPFDIGPLVLFIFAGIYVFPRFYKSERSIFAGAILLCAIPGIASEMHIAFGSERLLDNHFIIAHSLKIFQFLVPFSGLVLDYFVTYQKEMKAVIALESAQLSLRDKTLELEDKNKELERFAFIVSHDLQQPISNVGSFIELFKKEYYGNLEEGAKKYIDYIDLATGRIKGLVKGLLDYSRIGKSEEKEKIDCSLMMNEILEDLGFLIKDCQAEIEIKELPIVEAYRVELRLLLQNLLSNSLKYRREDAHPIISIRSNEEEKNWEFAVEDNGIGIEEKYKEKIFIIFQRLHSNSEYEESGIGLAHCKKIIDLHGGKIWVESDGLKGTTFLFTIPKNV